MLSISHIVLRLFPNQIWRGGAFEPQLNRQKCTSIENITPDEYEEALYRDTLPGHNSELIRQTFPLSTVSLLLCLLSCENTRLRQGIS